MNKEEEDLSSTNQTMRLKTTRVNASGSIRINPKFHKNTKGDLSDNIIETYHNDINNILETSPPEKSQAYVLLILNCNTRFYNLFDHKMHKNRAEISSIALSLNENIQNIGLSLATIFPGNVTMKPCSNDVPDHLKDNSSFRLLIKEIFEEIDKTNECLLDTLLNKFALFNSKKMKETRNEYYYECSKVYSELSPYEDRENYLPYYEFHYEDFLIIFCSIIHYYTGLFIRLELSDKESLKILMKIYGNDKTYSNLADTLGCSLQLKPYALKYEMYVESKRSHNIRKEQTRATDQSIPVSSFLETPLINKTNNSKRSKNIIQFSAVNKNNPLHFPPYCLYDKTKDIKYRRYEPNDKYHECKEDPEFSVMPNFDDCFTCSKFRNIDKLRLIHKSLEQLFRFKSLYTNNLMTLLLYQRNYISYQKDISTSNIFKDNLRMFHKKNLFHLINIIRNFYGEYISFYYLWVSVFCKWMIFPSLLGLISLIMKYSNEPKLQTEVETFQNYKLNYTDISLIVQCGIITLWATLYLKGWKKQEKFFAYVWGMEKYHKNESISETFISNEEVPFVFGEKLKIDNTFYRCRQVTSMFILVMMIAIRIWLTIKLLDLKETETPTMGRDITVACISGLVVKIMSMLYQYLARLFANWENYKKYSQQQNSFALKLIMFEFVNNYASLFYIAFYKPYQGKPCIDGNCYFELEIQLYTLILINFSFNAYEIGWPWLQYKLRLRKVASQPVNHSIHHQLLCEGYFTLINEYNERMISFGFVCLFTVAAPLTPVFVLLSTFFESFFDLYKMFNLLRIEIIEGSSGIGIYNSVLKTIYFVGMLTSVALVLFVNPHLLQTKEYQNGSLLYNNDFINKIIIFAIVENAIMIIRKAIPYNEGPLWFEHLEEFKAIYENKYFNREKNKLPHNIYSED